MQNLMEKQLNYFNIHKLTLIVFFLVGCFSYAAAQNTYKLIKTFPVEGSVFAADELKNAFVVNNENNVIKLDSLGSLTAIFSQNEFGEVSAIDASNPFQPLVFYKNFNTIIALDLNMTAKQMYKLSTIGIEEATAMCSSYDNTIWVFEQGEQKLKKINANYEITQESFEVDKLLGGILEPTFMIERNKRLFVVDPDRGIFVFDAFGTYFRSYLFNNIQQLQVIDSKMVFYKDENLYVVDLMTQQEDTIELPEEVEGIKAIQVTRNYLMLLTADELLLYKVKVG